MPYSAQTSRSSYRMLDVLDFQVVQKILRRNPLLTLDLTLWSLYILGSLRHF
jgi:hypothetical protein